MEKIAEPFQQASEVHTRNTTIAFPFGFVRDIHNRTVLLKWGNWVVASYGPAMATSFFFGFLAAAWYDLMSGQPVAGKLFFYLCVAVPCILVGCRVTSILLDWRELFRSPLRTILKPGYMLQGGIMGAALAIVGYGWFTNTSLLAALDAGAFGVTLGEAIGRLGCYVYGCCWGKPIQGNLSRRWGVRYTSPSAKVLRCAPHLHNVPLHPAPIYAFAAYSLLFISFCFALPHIQYDGFLVSSYLIVHPLIRMVLERFRDDDRGNVVGTITHTNLYSLFMLFAGLLIFGYSDIRATRVDHPLSFAGLLSPSLVFQDGSIVAWLSGIALAAFAAFGLHYRQVGTWLGNHDKPSS